MTQGIEIRDGTGALSFSTTDTTWNLIRSETVLSNQTKTLQLPSYSEYLVTRQMIGQAQGDDEAMVHGFSRSGQTLSITNPGTDKTTDTLFMIFGR